MKPIEEIGLLKMDFLGLRNLDVIESALDIIERSTGERGPTWRRCRSTTRRPTRCSPRGDSIGVFQFESDGMREALREGASRPSSRTWSRSSRCTARARCATSTPTRATSATPTRVKYLDERLRPITESTYSVILYQEQSMQIAKEIAGFTGPQADDLRKAIGKKDRAKMAGMKRPLLRGRARHAARCRAVIEELWAINEAAADYSFNKSHAACYALIAYRTAWLKANYPAEYMAALISSVMSTKDKVPFFVSRCEEMGIEVLPPDVNESGHDFVVVERQHPLRARRGQERRLGRGRRDHRGARGGRPVHLDLGLLRARRLPRASTRRRSSRWSSAARSTRPAPRARGCSRSCRRRRPPANKVQQDAQLGQGSIFDLERAGCGEAGAGSARAQPRTRRCRALEDDRKRRSTRWRRRRSGCSSPAHPLKEVRPALRAQVDCSLAELGDQQGRRRGSRSAA